MIRRSERVSEQVAVEVDSVTKKFGDIKALNGVTLRVRRLGVLVGIVVARSGWSRCQTRRARWRLRQRMASRRVLPSACLRAR